MKTIDLRGMLLAGCAALAMAGGATAAQAQAQSRDYAIGRQDLASALRAYSLKSGQDVVYDPSLVRGRVSPGASGHLTDEAALKALLSGSRLTVRRTPAGGLSIVPEGQATSPQAEPAGDLTAQAALIDEVIVTAGKRAERLQDLAGGASAVTGQQLQAAGAQSNADYLGRIPGVVFNEGTSGQSAVTIRGVGATAGIDQGQGPTGYFLNEIPLTEPSYASGIPDVDTFDLNRVEVLRGPQGSLFGSASLGGAINYIVNTADTSDYDAATETTVRQIARSGKASYAVKGMVNVPIIQDRLAVRVAGFSREDAGYIKNLGTGTTNNLQVNGVRGSVVFTPTDRTTLSLLSLYQKNKSDEIATTHSTFGPFARSTILPGPTDYDFEIHSLRLDHEFDFANLTILASTNTKDHLLKSDVTRTSALRTFAPKGVLSEEDMHTNMKTLEARLASKGDGSFKWLIGGMYSETQTDVATLSSLPTGAAVLASRYNAVQLQGEYFNRTYSHREGSEKALFGEVSYEFLPKVTATVGGRLFDTKYWVEIERYGINYGLTGQMVPRRNAGDDGFVPKVSLAWRPSRDLTVFALASKGFRFGNPNTVVDLPGFDTPAAWASDSLWNYELGAHSSWLNGRLEVDASIYNIDWSDIQVRLVRPGDNFTYGTNAGSARIRGVELAVVGRPTNNLTLMSNITYLDAKLTETVRTASPPLLEGTRLPGASPWQISNSATYRFDAPLSPVLTVSHRYLDEAPETLQGPDVKVAGYNQFDARLNFSLETVDVALFATNIANKRAVAFGYGLSTNGTGLNEFVIRPRTVGVTVNWKLR
ncbi:TonB-dependent receptor [Caulobacter sp.]|uniref:TonB-dependent receptor n=1 Tax=Caulobacter sp. TaxID=78 RepID=UPI0031E0BB74